MLITSTGVSFILLIILTLKKYDYLIILLIISSVFQAASVINIGETGIPIYAFMQIVLIITFIFKTVLLKIYTITPILSKQEKLIYVILFLFYIWSALGALVLPIIFEGLPVFNPRIGIDSQYGIGNQTALIFSSSNIAQFIYLSLNIMTFILIVNYVKNSTFNQVKKLQQYLIYFAIFFSGYHIFSFLVINFQFIDNFLYNNPSYSIGNRQQYSLFYRISGPFLEPSMSGSFFAAFTAALFFENKNKSSIFLFFISLLFLLLTTSSNGYLTFILTIFLIFILKSLYMVSNKKYDISLSSIKIIFILIIFSILVTIIFFDRVVEVLNFVIASKGDSDSFLHRIYADKYAFDIFIQTYGFGCGLGSNRPSSFVPYLFSNVGIIGFLLLFSLIFLILRNAIKYITNSTILFSFIIFVGIFISMLIAIPDISYSYFWIFLAILFGLMRKQDVINNNGVQKC